MDTTHQEPKKDVIVSAHDIKKCFLLGDEEVWALKGITLDIYRGEFLSIMGPSGSGKSTFFNQIGALDEPTSGQIFFEGKSLLECSEPEQAWIRCNKIGYIFQTFNLINVMSALQNVMLPMTFQGASNEEATARATRILDRVGLGHRLHHKPDELSGGQQQRCAIARSLANTPDLILADEPTGNLDTQTGNEIIELLRSLNREKGVTVICSTHDSKMLAASDRVCWIRDGLIERIATGHEFRLEEMAADTTGR
jgi:putative ABC transport system ATP-binding protein